MKLEILGTMKICPKCGEDGFIIRYEDGKSTEEVEYMKIICLTCQYTKKEAPLNKEYKMNKDNDFKNKKVCNWKPEEDDIYKTECGNIFQLTNNDTSDENGFKFCLYCGGELKYAILHQDEINKLLE